MVDPLFTPVVVGNFVSAFFIEVVSAAKSAYAYKEKCQKVLESVNKLQSHINEANNHLANWDNDQLHWLKEIKALLDKARDVATKGLEESTSEKVKRGMNVLKRKKKPFELLDIVRQIEEAKANVVFVATYFSQMNALEKKLVRDFVPQDVSSCVVGVEEPFRKLKQSILAAHAKDTVSIFGLNGIGGAGKTLLAHRLHNDRDIKEMYGAESIMWITVGHDAKVSDCYKKMASYLNNEGYDDKQTLEDQRANLLHVLSKKKVFMILDDVWQESFEKDHEMIWWLNIAGASGSATLITSRNKTVISRAVALAQSLMTSKVHTESQQAEALPDEDSWKLFSFHAFQGNSLPTTISEKTARAVCNECKGLPLALKVIGSAMMDKAEEYEWCSVLYDLQQAQPISGSTKETEMFGRLRLSYDMLKEDALKMCFLYFGAFLEDYEIPIETLFDIWTSEELFGPLDRKVARQKAMEHLRLLEKQSLIHWNREDAHVQVHDVLRDLALYIIDKAKSRECAYECYFQASKVIEAFPSGEHLQAIKRMSLMNSDIRSKWPKDFEAPRVKVLLLSSVTHNGMQGEWKDFGGFRALRYLDLSRNIYVKELLRSIEKLKCLTTLNLEGCLFLKELPTNIGKLMCLTTLNLAGCLVLKELPTSIGKLKCLTTLNLSHCSFLKELPTIIGELKCLITLNLERCSFMRELPTSIGKLKCLTTLNLSNCSSLQKLPTSIGEVKCLTTLNLARCSVLRELPTSIAKLKCLTTLNLSNCSSLQELPTSIGKLTCLTTLNLAGCSVLRELPTSIGKLKCLTTLNPEGCSFLRELPTSIGKLKCLTTLNLWRCLSLKELPTSIGELKCLTILNLERCKSLKELPTSIGELKCLTTLNLSHCSSLKKLPTIVGELKCLTTLNLWRCSSLKELPTSIGELKCLTTLNLSDCSSLKELPTSIGELKCLTILNLARCSVLRELPISIGELKCLITLNLARCSVLRELPTSIGELKCLRTLNLAGCSVLTELPTSIGELKCLTILNLAKCSVLRELPTSIGELKYLTTLNLAGCSVLRELPTSIGELKYLTTLNLSDCSSLKELPSIIGELKCLTTLDLWRCSSLKELPTSIGELKYLTTLNLSDCSSLKELPTIIGELKCLTTLNLSHCSSLKELPTSIGVLKCLTTLNLEGCQSLEELPTNIGEFMPLSSHTLMSFPSGDNSIVTINASELECTSTSDAANLAKSSSVSSNIIDLVDRPANLSSSSFLNCSLQTLDCAQNCSEVATPACSLDNVVAVTHEQIIYHSASTSLMHKINILIDNAAGGSSQPRESDDAIRDLCNKYIQCGRFEDFCRDEGIHGDEMTEIGRGRLTAALFPRAFYRHLELLLMSTSRTLGPYLPHLLQAANLVVKDLPYAGKNLQVGESQEFFDEISNGDPVDVDVVYSLGGLVAVCEKIMQEEEHLETNSSIDCCIVQHDLTRTYLRRRVMTKVLEEHHIENAIGVLEVKVTDEDVHVGILRDDESYYSGTLKDFAYPFQEIHGDSTPAIDEQCATRLFGHLKGAEFLSGKKYGLKCNPLLVVSLVIAIQRENLVLKWNTMKGHMEIENSKHDGFEKLKWQILYTTQINELGLAIEWGMEQMMTSEIATSSVSETSKHSQKIQDLASVFGNAVQHKRNLGLQLNLPGGVGIGGNIDLFCPKGKELAKDAELGIRECLWAHDKKFVETSNLDMRHAHVKTNLLQGRLSEVLDNYLVVWDDAKNGHVSVYWAKDDGELKWYTDILLPGGKEEHVKLFKSMLKGLRIEVKRDGSKLVSTDAQKSTSTLKDRFKRRKHITIDKSMVEVPLGSESNDEWVHLIGPQAKYIGKNFWWEATHMRAIVSSRTSFSSGAVLETFVSNNKHGEIGHCNVQGVSNAPLVHNCERVVAWGQFSKAPASIIEGSKPKKWGGLVDADDLC